MASLFQPGGCGITTFFWAALAVILTGMMSFAILQNTDNMQDNSERNQSLGLGPWLRANQPESTSCSSKQWLPLLDSWEDASRGILHKCLRDELLTPMTRQVHERIATSQADCANSRSIHVAVGFTGIGSNIHTMGSIIGYTLDTDRVAVWQRDAGQEWADGIPDEICESTPAQGDGRGFRCMFMPLQAPTPQCNALLEQIPVAVTDENLNSSEPALLWDFFGALNSMKAPPSSSQVPVVFRADVDRQRVPDDVQYYWWRAQSAAHILRLTPSMAKAVRERFWELYPEGVPARCVSLHMRMGDKHTEATTSSFDEYWKATTTLIAEQPLSLSRCVVATTDTQSAVEAVTAAAARDGFHLIIADVERAHENGGPWENRKMRPAWEEMRDSLAHLIAALKADAFVGTRTSNWCRLIDELRSTVAGKAAAPFIDLHADQRGLGTGLYGW